jgi:hypothetical protein
MTVSMRPFIIETLRKITEELSALPKSSADCGTGTHEQILDITVAESLSGGSFIFPSTDSNCEEAWCVFAFHTVDASDGSLAFRLRGKLGANETPNDFAALAYELILMRSIDETGRSIYPELLEKLVLSRRDVLRILADCSEALNLKTRYVIVSEPSPWLPQLRRGHVVKIWAHG